MTPLSRTALSYGSAVADDPSHAHQCRCVQAVQVISEGGPDPQDDSNHNHPGHRMR